MRRVPTIALLVLASRAQSAKLQAAEKRAGQEAAAEQMPTDAKMDLKNRALCFALRHPAKGGARVPLHTIVQKRMVKKTDGTVPTEAAISKAAKNFAKEQGARGRPAGTKATTRQEDRAIMSKFKQLRPPGAYVDSRIVHKNLPKKIQEKVGRRTVLRRLAAKGYVTQTKLSKTDLGPKQCAKRTNWCRKFKCCIMRRI